jgi:hypothetical protein
MQTLSQFAPALLMLFLQVAVYIAQNRGYLTADQSMALMATMAPLGVHVAYKMQPQAAKPSAVEAVQKAGPIALLGLLLLLVTGCAHGKLNDAKYARAVESGKLGAAPTPSAYCRSLDAQRSTLGFLGKLAAGSATVAAGSVVYWEKQTSDNIAAITAASSAALSGALLWFSDDKDESFVRDCSQ